MILEKVNGLKRKDKDNFELFRRTAIITKDGWVWGHDGAINLNFIDEADRKFLTEHAVEIDKTIGEVLKTNIRGIVDKREVWAVERVLFDVVEPRRVWVIGGGEMASFNRSQFDVFYSIVEHETLVLTIKLEPNFTHKFRHILWFVRESDLMCQNLAFITSYADKRYKVSDPNEIRKEDVIGFLR
jgi:hypothetical protein